jgi:plasmid stabilization system protein ParE
MASRKIIWSVKAKITFKKILEFYNIRNGSNAYSIRLLSDIEKIISLLPENPELGLKTDISVNIRYLISGNYKLIYEIKPETIEILMVWDCRQNPKDLKI